MEYNSSKVKAGFLMPLLFATVCYFLLLPVHSYAQGDRIQDNEAATCLIKFGVDAGRLKKAGAAQNSTFAVDFNRQGVFRQVNVRSSEEVFIEMSYPSAKAGDKVVVTVLDGGKLDNGEGIKVLSLNGQKKCPFGFHVSGDAGLHRILVQKGNDAKLVQLWVAAPGDRGSRSGNDYKTQPAGYNQPVSGSGVNNFVAYTGNVRREVRDLEIWGGAGSMQLVWTRYYNSRNGLQSWTHAYHYTMTAEGLNDEGLEQLRVTQPEGGATMFTQSKADPNIWVAPGGIGRRIFQKGNNYFLQMPNGYRYRFEKITSKIYGTVYQLQDIRDASQNLYTLTYDRWHNLLRVTEPAGRFFELSYGVVQGKLLITKVATNDGRSVLYNYTVQNDGIQDWVLLSSVRYGDGTAANYSYGQSGPGKVMLLAHAIDPRLAGNAVNMRYVYDASVAEGYLKEERNGVTGDLMLSLTTAPGERWVCYANGSVQHYKMPAGGMGATDEHTDGLGRATRYKYDNAGTGFASSRTDALGRTTSYVRSIYGNTLEVIHPDGSREKWTRDDLDLTLSYTDESGNTTIYTRDALHRVTRITYPDGANEQFTYNGFGQVLTHTLRNGGVETNVYNRQALKTSFKDALGNVTAYSHDAAGHVVAVTDARGNTKRAEYNERGLRIKLVNADNTFQQLGYDEFGNHTLTTNELGNSWKKLYDEFKRVVISTDPLHRNTTYSYDLPGGGCACTHTDDKPTKITSPGGNVTVTVYNTEWQKTSETVGWGSPEAATTSYEYDAAGNVVSMIDPRSKVWTYEYDSRNRQKSVRDPYGNRTQLVYSAAGRIMRTIRADNSTIYNEYDKMGRLVKRTDPMGKITSAKYDEEGNMIEMADPANGRYRFEYDLRNQRTKMIYPEGSFESYSYDAVGNLASHATRAKKVLSYTYDFRNREISSIWSDGTPSAISSYDAAGRLLMQSSSISVLHYKYDAANQLTGESQDISGGAGPAQLMYAYNADGQRSSMTYPGGTTVLGYDYTARKQVSSISVNDGYLASYSYDLNGNRIGEFHKNATSSAYTYDDANRTVSITHQKAGVSFVDYDYGYDNLNRRTFARRDHDKGDAFTYDKGGQLTGVQYDASDPANAPKDAARTVNYDYDATGNRVNVADNGSSTNYTSNNLNQYTSVGSNVLTYNTNGSLQTHNGWTYTYDAQERLIKAQKPGTTMEFAYDARNRCVKRAVNGVAAYLYYDDWSLIQERRRRDIIQYMHGPRIDELIAKQSTVDGIVYYHHDVLGNVTQLTNTLGNVVEQYAYDVFGAATIKDAKGKILSGSAYGNRFMFNGREYITEIGLYDYRNRMYSSELGRFLQVDPIRFEGGDYNMYRYVLNDPLNLKDPFGTQCIDDWTVILFVSELVILELIIEISLTQVYSNGIVVGEFFYFRYRRVAYFFVIVGDFCWDDVIGLVFLGTRQIDIYDIFEVTITNHWP